MRAQPRLALIVLVAAVVLGLALRLLMLWSRGSLWGDEAALALNIEPKTFLELGRPFVYRQVAPWGVLAGMKVVTIVFGTSDSAFRLLPFIGSSLALVLVYPIGRRLGGAWAGAFAVVLMAGSYWMVYYAAETKPYAIDAAVTAGLFILCIRVLDAPDKRSGWIALLVGGLVATWTSLPSLFVLGAVGTTLALDAYEAKAYRRLGVVCGIGVAWLVGFYLHYTGVIVQSEMTTSKVGTAYWNPGFAPFPPKELSDFRWYAGKYFYAFDDPGGLAFKHAAGLLAAFGAVVTFRKNRRLFVLIVGPVALALVAAMMQKYPFLGRLLMFATPSLMVMLAVGLATLVGHEKVGFKFAAVALLAVLVVPVTGATTLRIVQEPKVKNFGDLMADLGTRRRPGEKVLLAGSGLLTMYDHYGPKNGLGQEYVGTDDVRKFDGDGRFVLLPEMASMVFGESRVWVFLSTFQDPRDPNQIKRATEPLSTFVPRYFERNGGVLVESYKGAETNLYLYDLSEAVLPEGDARYANPAGGSPSASFDSTRGEP